MINLDNKKLIILPASITFLIALLLIYKFSFPISWDVYYHIHMADLYMNEGLVFWDYSTVAPYGRLIMYPPLFHLALGFISKLININLIDLTRLLQPCFAFYLIFIITYCGYKLFDVKEGIVAGFLGMCCFVTLNRSLICTPATIAIGLSMLSCVYFFTGFMDNNRYELISSAIFLSLISNLHMATCLMTIGVLGLYSSIELLRHKLNSKYLLMYILIFIVIGLPWWFYVELNYGLFFNSQQGTLLSIINFIYKYYGVIPFLLTLGGFYVLYKDKSECALFLIIWSLSLVALSQSVYIGVKTVSIRILELASYPLILIAGIGLGEFYNCLKNCRIKKVILVVLISYAVLSSLMYVDSYVPDILTENDYDGTIFSNGLHMTIDPIGTILKPSIISSRNVNSQLAHDRYDVMNWFMQNSNGSVVVCEDSIMDTIIVSTSQTPVVYGGFTESIPKYVVDPVHIISNQSTKSEISELHIGYILLNKNTQVPIYAQEVYTNQNYKICTIKQDFFR